MRKFNVGKLKKILDGLPDDTPVITPTHDHSFIYAGAYAETVLENGDLSFLETYNEDETIGKRVLAVVIC